MEVVWDKGSSGLVFYTDANYWDELEGGIIIYTKRVMYQQKLLLTLMYISGMLKGSGKLYDIAILLSVLMARD